MKKIFQNIDDHIMNSIISGSAPFGEKRLRHFWTGSGSDNLILEFFRNRTFRHPFFTSIDFMFYFLPIAFFSILLFYDTSFFIFPVLIAIIGLYYSLDLIYLLYAHRRIKLIYQMQLIEDLKNTSIDSHQVEMSVALIVLVLFYRNIVISISVLVLFGSLEMFFVPKVEIIDHLYAIFYSFFWLALFIFPSAYLKSVTVYLISHHPIKTNEGLASYVSKYLIERLKLILSHALGRSVTLYPAILFLILYLFGLKIPLSFFFFIFLLATVLFILPLLINFFSYLMYEKYVCSIDQKYPAP